MKGFVCFGLMRHEEATKPNVDREQISPQTSNVTLVSIETEFNELASNIVIFSNTQSLQLMYIMQQDGGLNEVTKVYFTVKLWLSSYMFAGRTRSI